MSDLYFLRHPKLYIKHGYEFQQSAIPRQVVPEILCSSLKLKLAAEQCRAVPPEVN